MRFQVQLIQGVVITEVVNCDAWEDVCQVIKDYDLTMEDTRYSLEIISTTEE